MEPLTVTGEVARPASRCFEGMALVLRRHGRLMSFDERCWKIVAGTKLGPGLSGMVTYEALCRPAGETSTRIELSFVGRQNLPTSIARLPPDGFGRAMASLVDEVCLAVEGFEFECLIPERPISAYDPQANPDDASDRLLGPIRQARLWLGRERLTVNETTDPARVAIPAVEVPIRSVAQARLNPLPADRQIEDVVLQSLGAAIVVSLLLVVVAVGATTLAGDTNRRDQIIFAVLAVLAGVGLVTVFSLLPGLGRVNRDLIAVSLLVADGRIVWLAIGAEQESDFRAALQARDITCA